MLKNFRLWVRIILGMGVAIAFAVAALTYSNLRNMEAVIGEAERAELRQHVEAILVSVAAETRMAEALSALVDAASGNHRGSWGRIQFGGTP